MSAVTEATRGITPCLTVSLVQPKVVSFGINAKRVYGEEIEGRSNVPYVIDRVVLSKAFRAMSGILLEV